METRKYLKLIYTEKTNQYCTLTLVGYSPSTQRKISSFNTYQEGRKAN